MIREDCLEISEKFADERRTLIEEGDADDFEIESLIQEHDVVVTISHEGYVKRLPVDTYRSQGRGGTGIRGSQTKEDDFVEHVFVSTTHTDLMCFTNTGRVFRMKVWQIPEMSRTSRGRPIQNLIGLRQGETARFFLPVADFEKSEDYLFFATASGKVKRTSLKDYRNVNRSGIIAINLNEGDRLVGVVQSTGDSHVLLATSSGMAIRFNEDDARIMGRAAAGVKGIDISGDDEVIGLVRCDAGDDLLTVTQNGYGKRTSLDDYLVQSEDGSTRPQGRGGKGRIDIKATPRNGKVVAVRPVKDVDGAVFVTQNGQLIRTDVNEISRMGRNTQGVRVVRLRDGDSLIAMARVVTDD